MATEVLATDKIIQGRTKESITQAAKNYASAVREVLPVAKAYLFGSWVTGHPTVWSDVDVCFFLESYGGKSRLEAITECYRVRRPYLRFILEPHVLLASSLAQDDPFVAEIMKTGVEL
ncbi:MAG: nucleotidyltransferase domain-containing protein [Deltaproteobacteria bacterium]|jgi:predicted nucleotidyltransferase|nr:nucleotidyltransferase domain-containing protein [Deltaproteobacteria bacterium]